LVIDESKTAIKERDLSFTANEADNYALEEALRLKEKHSGEVVAFALGGDEASKVLRACLAMGADRAVHISDSSLRGAPEFAVAEALAKAVEKDGGTDLILTGVQSDDRGSGVTGAMLAALLDYAQATIVIRVDADPESRRIRADRELEGGLVETVDVQTPAVLTIQYGINQPRYATLKGIMAAKKKPFAVWSAADLGLAPQAPLYVVRSLAVPERQGKVEILHGTPEEAAAALVEKLRREAKVL
jgi:electron transfer flavoprotein beta subunit